MKRLSFKSPRFSRGSHEPAPILPSFNRAIFIGVPSEDSMSTDASMTPNLHLSAGGFRKELEKVGQGIPDRNPIKETRSRSGSPDLKGLPFQRRTRSNSPLNSPILFGQGPLLFPSNSPIRATKAAVQAKASVETTELKRVSMYRYEATMEIDSSSDSSSDEYA